MTIAILGGLGLYVNKSGNTSALLISSPKTNTPAVIATNQGGSAVSTVASSNSSNAASGQGYKDGNYIGSAAQTPYGTVQVAAVISGGKITDINFLQMPNDLGNSRAIAAAAEPLLKQTALQKQSAHIDFVSGATSDSYGFEQSLQAALDKAASS